jgi:WD40 repeat protein
VDIVAHLSSSPASQVWQLLADPPHCEQRSLVAARLRWTSNSKLPPDDRVVGWWLLRVNRLSTNTVRASSVRRSSRIRSVLTTSSIASAMSDPIPTPAVAPAAAAAATAPASQPNADGLEDTDNSEVFIESTWRSRAVRYDREMQSDTVACKEAASQARQMKSAGAQTESKTGGELKPDAPLPPSFPSFLSSVYPALSAQLTANAESTAFEEYWVAWEEERDAWEKVVTLQNSAAIAELGVAPAADHMSPLAGKKKRGGHASSSEKEPEHASITGVSWSCNGAVLVASYAASSHVGWCNHSASTLSFWNIMRRQISSTRPDFTLDQECCCMCLAYHPERPTILAGGMFNGEVRVWDTALIEDLSTTAAAGADDKQQEEKESSSSSTAAASSGSSNPCIMRSSIDDHFHREPISRLEWVRDSNRQWQLVSVAGDGKVLIWPMEDPLNKLEYPTDGYILTPSEKYSGQKLTSTGGGGLGMGGAGRNKFSVLGGTAIAFAPQSASGDNSSNATGSASSSVGASHSFLASTEGGGLLRLPLSTILKRRGYLKSGESKWNRDAYRLVEQCDPAAKFDVKKLVEKYAKSSGAEAIELSTIFAARPAPASLYPSAVDLTYEGHAGPVYGLAFCRFERRIWASASTDGRIKVFQINNVRATSSRLTINAAARVCVSVWRTRFSTLADRTSRALPCSLSPLPAASPPDPRPGFGVSLLPRVVSGSSARLRV